MKLIRFAPAATMALLVILAPDSTADLSLQEGLSEAAIELVANLENSEVRKIAVVGFEDINGFPSALGPFIAEELVTQFFQVRPGRFEVIERGQLARVLEEQKLSQSSLFDEQTITEIGKILGIEAIITGSITDIGSGVRINIRAVSVESARLFAATAVTINKDETVRSLLDQSANPNIQRNTVGNPQPSSAFFKNDFLRVTVASFTVKRENRINRVTLALNVENLTGEELFLLAPAFGCGISLVDNLGNTYKVDDVTGINCKLVNYAQDRHYIRIDARGRTSIIAELYNISQDPHGSQFSFAFELNRLKNGRNRQFTAGINGILAMPYQN